MAKQSQKQNFINSSLNQRIISFNNESFNLGNKKILKGLLTKQTRDLLTKIYKQKMLDECLYKQPTYIDRKMRNQQIKIPISQMQAIKLIKQSFLRKVNPQIFSQKKIQKITSQLNNKFTYKQNKYLNLIINDKMILEQKLKSYIKQFKQQVRQIKIIQIDRQRWERDLVGRIAIRMEREIFVHTIIMVLEITSIHKHYNQYNKHYNQPNTYGNQPNTYYNKTNSIIVFQQSYKTVELQKDLLIRLIGKDTYDAKIKAGQQIYRLTQQGKLLHNQNWLACHQCMKLLPKVTNPHQKCNFTSLSPHISSPLLFSPYQVCEKMINSNHFSLDFPQFHHNYQSYCQIQKRFVCNRYWCEECFIKARKSNTARCQFCYYLCTCVRCRKYQSMVQLLAYYVKLNGNLPQLQDKFLFNFVYKKQIYNSNINDRSTYRSIIKFMYDQNKLLHQQNAATISQIKKNSQGKSLQNDYVILNNGKYDQLSRYETLIKISQNKNKINQLLLNETIQQRIKNRKKQKNQVSQKEKKQRIKKLSQQTREQLQKCHRQQIQMTLKKLIENKIINDKLPVLCNEIRPKTYFQQKQNQNFKINLITQYPNRYFQQLFNNQKDQQKSNQIQQKSNQIQQKSNQIQENTHKVQQKNNIIQGQRFTFKIHNQQDDQQKQQNYYQSIWD